MKKKSPNGRALIETVNVANKCDYERTNGKCGSALCEDYFGKPCPGRTCPDWLCEAEGDASVSADSTCGTTTAVALVGQNTYQKRVSDQYAAIETAKDNLLRECVKFGALLTEVGYFLGEARHAKNDGEGLKTWLEENCPEVNYNTAMGYKALAAKCVKMLGGGSQAVAVLQDKTEVVPPGEDAPIEVDSKFIEKRDELFNEVKSRRELEQTYFKFMASEGKGKRGRKEGSKAAQVAEEVRKAKTAAEKAADAEHEMRELIGALGAFLTRGGKVQMLSDAAKSDFHRSLVDYAEVLAELI